MTNKKLEDLATIRSLMEQSSRFISLNGWSGIFAGIYAMIASGLAYLSFQDMDIKYFDHNVHHYPTILISKLFYIGMASLILAIGTGIYLTVRKSKRNGWRVWSNVSRRLLVHLFVPLIAGGIFCIALYLNNLMIFIAPTTLIFYGLALLNASKFTFNDIRYLGYCELVLGLLGLFFLGFGLVFWTLGFGILHIVYGILMQQKYH